MAENTLLIAGASGVVGRAALAHFAPLPDWNVIGLSRRPPDTQAGTHISVDLQEAAACKQAIEKLPGVTHLIYAALFEKPGLIAGWREQDQMETNLSMFRNLMDPIEQRSGGLRHVYLLQGTKAYGAHVKPMRIPGREREPRVEHENFYWLQEDELRSRQKGKDWSWSIWRPQIIFGHALGAPMNLLVAIGVYAAICRAQDVPFSYPGGPCAPTEAVDARLIAKAFHWAADNPAAQNEIFNITNGDVCDWQALWPNLADCFGMEVGEADPQLLHKAMPAHAEVWDQIVKDHALAPHTMSALVGDSFYYADALFSTGRETPPPPALLSTIKLRQAGLADCIDTVDMLHEWYDILRHLKILPPLP